MGSVSSHGAGSMCLLWDDWREQEDLRHKCVMCPNYKKRELGLANPYHNSMLEKKILPYVLFTRETLFFKKKNEYTTFKKKIIYTHTYINH